MSHLGRLCNEQSLTPIFYFVHTWKIRDRDVDMESPMSLSHCQNSTSPLDFRLPEKSSRVNSALYMFALEQLYDTRNI